MFTLDPTLQNDCHELGSFPLCRLLLCNNKTYPWFILVPQRQGLTELHQLDPGDREQLWNESASLSTWLAEVFAADKLNIAALGNVVSQLHVHHIARYRSDPAWPKPVWGVGAAVPYTEQEVAALRKRAAAAFAGALSES
jgi:diadenosine tetraphosphate (Ap4A) HIT family hydrolase